MIVFGIESILTIPEIVDNLAEVNHEESGHILPLNVDIAAYPESITKVFTLRDDNVLVGYSIFLVVPHPHHKGKVFAINDVVYVKPEYRAESKKFFDSVEQNLSADVIQYAMNYNKPHDNLMKSMGYFPLEIVYHKVVTQNG